MNQYTIYCTEAQTKKAFELGAPIKMSLLPSTWFEEVYPKRCHIDITENPNGCTLAIPTAEQMILWLEEKFIGSIDIIFDNPPIKWKYEKWGKNFVGYEYEDGFSTRQEATLAAIDAALEYLENMKL